MLCIVSLDTVKKIITNYFYITKDPFPCNGLPLYKRIREGIKNYV